MRRSILAFFTIVGVASCGSEAPVPDHPTWFDDVQPILRGNCLSCHGPTASKTARTTRWDVCDLKAFAAASPMFDTDTIHDSPDDPMTQLIGAKQHTANILAYAVPHGGGRPLMPPKPAPVLTDRQAQVLVAWQKAPDCGKRAVNAKPTASWVQKGRKYVVEDGDDDQVLGTIACGTVTEPVLSSGAHDLPAGTSAPCTLSLSDGQDAVTVALPP